MQLISILVSVVMLAITASVNPPSYLSSEAPGTRQARVEKRQLPRWVRDIAALSDREAWAVCEKGFLLHTIDGGETWSHQRLEPFVSLRAITFMDPQRGFVAGNDGVLFATNDGGRSWTPRRTPTTHSLSDLFFVGELGWAAGYWGTILHTKDGGQTWYQQPVPADKPLEGIFFINERLGWAAGWSGAILHTVDGGQSWQRQLTPRGVASLHAVYFRDELQGWAVGMFGVIMHTTDGGQIWKRQESPSGAALYDLVFTRNGHGVIAGRNEMLISDDWGETWRSIRPNLPGSIESLALSGDRLWGSGMGLLANSMDGGANWIAHQVDAKGDEITISFTRKRRES
jgi:photosystem II stability/assembly factor-like uncharacterized protein